MIVVNGIDTRSLTGRWRDWGRRRRGWEIRGRGRRTHISKIIVLRVPKRIRLRARLGVLIEVRVRLGILVEAGIRLGVLVEVGVRLGVLVEVGVWLGILIEVRVWVV